MVGAEVRQWSRLWNTGCLSRLILLLRHLGSNMVRKSNPESQFEIRKLKTGAIIRVRTIPLDAPPYQWHYLSNKRERAGRRWLPGVPLGWCIERTTIS